MKYEAHRGVGTEFPENTMPAFKAAAIQGYDYIELDPYFTKDGQLVVLHDKTLNRTCRHSDGSEIQTPLPINTLTYDEVLEYDAGIAKSVKFKGTKIPLLSDVLSLAKETGLTIKLDNRIQAFNAEQTEALYSLVEKSGAKTAFTSSDIDYIKKTTARFPDAEIHYDGYVDEETLKTLTKIVKNGLLTVWLCLKSAMTSWVTVPAADTFLCETVKKYGNLGLWILYDEEQLLQAENFGAQIIETTGSLKPARIEKGLFNCHSHTKFSHDSACEPTDSFHNAKQKGLGGFAITDHCDIGLCESMDIKIPILKSVAAARELGSYVLSGVELGEAIWNPVAADDILKSINFDLVLGPVHAVRYDAYTMPFSGIDFRKFSEKQLAEYMQTYFTDMLETIESCDFDVLPHLTNPLKYITGKYGITIDLNAYSEIIDKILKKIIEKGIALEVNTSCLGSAYNELMPEKSIIMRFKELGGYLVTIGADAHTADCIAHGFTETVAFLKEIGFKQLYYYKNRIPVQYDLAGLTL